MKYSLHILLMIMLFASCNMDLDTINPQSSPNIASSIKDSFFRQEYTSDITSDSVFKIGEIWIEKSWKYSDSNFKDHFVKAKKVTGGIQLNFLISNFNNKQFQDSTFITGWNMLVDSSIYIGKRGDIYTTSFPNSNIPDSLEINIYKIKNKNLIKYYHFNIFKK